MGYLIPSSPILRPSVSILRSSSFGFYSSASGLYAPAPDLHSSFFSFRSSPPAPRPPRFVFHVSFHFLFPPPADDNASGICSSRVYFRRYLVDFGFPLMNAFTAYHIFSIPFLLNLFNDRLEVLFWCIGAAIVRFIFFLTFFFLFFQFYFFMTLLNVGFLSRIGYGKRDLGHGEWHKGSHHGHHGMDWKLLTTGVRFLYPVFSTSSLLFSTHTQQSDVFF